MTSQAAGQAAKPDLGQVAYEAYAQASGGVSLVSGQPLPGWGEQAEDIRMAWRMSAGAVLIEDAAQERTAPELAAAMAESRQYRELLTEILATFGTPAKPGTVRWTAKQVAGWRKRAGLETR